MAGREKTAIQVGMRVRHLSSGKTGVVLRMGLAIAHAQSYTYTSPLSEGCMVQWDTGGHGRIMTKHLVAVEDDRAREVREAQREANREALSAPLDAETRELTSRAEREIKTLFRLMRENPERTIELLTRNPDLRAAVTWLRDLLALDTGRLEETSNAENHV